MISTISVAEYCVRGDVHELPLRNLQIIPFNLDHAKRAGEFAKIIFQNKGKLKLNERNIIPNDPNQARRLSNYQWLGLCLTDFKNEF